MNTITLETPINEIEKQSSLSLGKHVGAIKNREISDVEIAESETKVRVICNFQTQGAVRDHSRISATPDSKFFTIMKIFGALRRLLIELIGRKVGFDVSLSHKKLR